jgi:hypothetical protein
MERTQKETVWPDLKYDLGIETKGLSKTAKHFGIASLRGEVLKYDIPNTKQAFYPFDCGVRCPGIGVVYSIIKPRI